MRCLPVWTGPLRISRERAAERKSVLSPATLEPAEFAEEEMSFVLFLVPQKQDKLQILPSMCTLWIGSAEQFQSNRPLNDSTEAISVISCETAVD